MTLIATGVLLGMLAAVVPPEAQAISITYSFTGTVSSVRTVSWVVYIAVGDNVYGIE